MATKLTAGQRLERSRRTTHSKQHAQKLEQQANQSRLVQEQQSQRHASIVAERAQRQATTVKDRIDRQTASAYERAQRDEARQRARDEATAARTAQTERTRRISSIQSGISSSGAGNGTFSPIGGTAASRSVGSSTRSVGHSFVLVIGVITGIAVIYLMVSNGGQGGSVIINGINNFLTAFTSGQPLFKSTSGNSSSNGTIPPGQLPSGAANQGAQSIQGPSTYQGTGPPAV